jgi:chemotaxis receptor (MCP) glutamine deamidase CheD
MASKNSFVIFCLKQRLETLNISVIAVDVEYRHSRTLILLLNRLEAAFSRSSGI